MNGKIATKLAAIVAAALIFGAPLVSRAEAQTTRVALPPCSSTGLVVWLNTQANGAAGTFYYTLEFTNLSGHSCQLAGYPGVSGINLAGQQLGSAATRNGAHTVRTVTLKNGGSATAVLGINDVGVFGANVCRPVNEAGLRVYVPGQTAAKTIPYPFLGCSKAGPTYLHIEAVQPA